MNDKLFHTFAKYNCGSITLCVSWNKKVFNKSEIHTALDSQIEKVIIKKTSWTKLLQTQSRYFNHAKVKIMNDKLFHTFTKYNCGSITLCILWNKKRYLTKARYILHLTPKLRKSSLRKPLKQSFCKHNHVTSIKSKS